MDVPQAPLRNEPTAGPGRVRGNGWIISSAIGLGLLAAYLANGREIGTYDTEPTTLTALTLVRGEGIYLDRFAPVLWEPDGRRPPYVGRSGRHLVSLHPIATAVLAAPLVAPQVWYLDRHRPGWDAHPIRAWMIAKRMAKRAAAVLAALAGVAIHRWLRRLVPAGAAIAATLVAGLGSNLWVVGSQALWQHGPAALMLALAAVMLAPERPERWRYALAGIATAMLVACRAIDLLFAVVILAWVAVRRREGLGWFLPGPMLIGAALLTYNFSLFDTLSGGQAQLESTHPKLHGVPGPWSGNLLEGMAGTLLSPARGLFVFCPWVAVSVILLPWTFRRLPRGSLARWLVVGLVPYLLLLSKYAVWWAGHTFGPRYWTEAAPVFAVMLATGLVWSWQRCRPMLVLLGLTAAWSVAIQAVGACCYPSSWNLFPKNVDRAHERLWDWHDTEIRRAIRETLESRQPTGGTLP